jgi:hypothetical protein
MGINPGLKRLNVYCVLLNLGTTTVEDGHKLLYKKSVLFTLCSYNNLEISDSFLIKNLQEHSKLINDHSWNRAKI